MGVGSGQWGVVSGEMGVWSLEFGVVSWERKGKGERGKVVSLEFGDASREF